MFYTVKLRETTTKVVLVEADSPESAQAKTKDGYGRQVTWPRIEFYTEIINTSHDPPSSTEKNQKK